MHCVFTLPPGDSNFSLRWRLIKSGFSRALPKTERRSPVRIAASERGIWQRHYLLGTCDSWWWRFSSPYRLCSYESGEARLGGACAGLAIFHFSSLRHVGCLSLGLVRWSCHGHWWWGLTCVRLRFANRTYNASINNKKARINPGFFIYQTKHNAIN